MHPRHSSRSADLEESLSGVVDERAHAEYVGLLRQHLWSYYRDTLGLEPQIVESAIAKRLQRTRGRALAALLNDLVDIEGGRMLDVGSGWGELLLACIERGIDAVGVEPDPTEVEISQLLLRAHGRPPAAVVGTGEDLPFPDESFDLVTCQQVLEHVRNIDQTVGEIVRVTRPGGSIFVSTPNYLFPYEGHYRMKWFPMTPKVLGKFILARRGRDPTFLLEHVNYTNYFQLKRLWRRHGLESRNVTAELVELGKHTHSLYRNPWLRFVLTRLKLYPNISWLLTKPRAGSELA